tara:strand:+ start:2236 stop:2430 length:195 start_codon:yes stop_codon:yes gene_type:complete
MIIQALIFTQEELNQFPIYADAGGIWNPVTNGVVYYLQIEARSELEAKGIQFTVGEVEIIQEEI